MSVVSASGTDGCVNERSIGLARLAEEQLETARTSLGSPAIAVPGPSEPIEDDWVGGAAF
ncbi:hypothetical protein [Parasphingorhabdus halotolerans]|uniref:Uncharacterized protein n=1 Tax=Parasphingorhabdus halotolerans TaxID=2725558 RepID=A0A6H2DQG1_9SPHN|nr:hypothetical protein [Parasphingorhabdus halotolerans]QJB69906.1 hypothetical protein HF685_11935 [Parasphingorhabdus halotolerans]